MEKKATISAQTRNNWWIDLALFASGIAVFFSSIYFLILPVGGYQGGRNPFYGIIILFARHTWGDIHIWGGVAMLAIAALHIPLHWYWIVNMTKRVFKIAMGQCKSMNACGKFNLAINALLGLSGLITAFSGLYFLLIPGASHNSFLADPRWLFPLATWDFIHTWSGVIMIAVVVLHLDIHWKWITKVTKKIFLSIVQTVGSLPKKESAKFS